MIPTCDGLIFKIGEINEWFSLSNGNEILDAYKHLGIKTELTANCLCQLSDEDRLTLFGALLDFAYKHNYSLEMDQI